MNDSLDFQDWYIKQYAKDVPHIPIHLFDIGINGKYIDGSVQESWEAWEAASKNAIKLLAEELEPGVLLSPQVDSVAAAIMEIRRVKSCEQAWYAVWDALDRPCEGGQNAEKTAVTEIKRLKQSRREIVSSLGQKLIEIGESLS